MTRPHHEPTRRWMPTFWAFVAAMAATCAAGLALQHIYALLANGIPLSGTLWVETVLVTGLGVLGAAYVGRARIALSRDALIVTNLLRTHVIPYAEIESVTGSLWGLAIARTGHRTLLAAALPVSTRPVRAGVHTREGQIAHAIMQAARQSELGR